MGVPIFLIFAPKHRLCVLVRTALARRSEREPIINVFFFFFFFFFFLFFVFCFFCFFFIENFQLLQFKIICIILNMGMFS